MEALGDFSASDRVGGRGEVSQLVSDARTSALRRVNFTHEKTVASSFTTSLENDTLGKDLPSGQLRRTGGATPLKTSQEASPFRSSSSLVRSHSRSNGVISGSQQTSNSAPSFARVQGAGGAQGSLGIEPQYGAYTAPPLATGVNRISPSRFRLDEQSAIPDTPRQRGVAGVRRGSGVERLIGTDISTACEKEEVPIGTAALHQALKALREATDVEERDRMQDSPDWQESPSGQEVHQVNEGVTEAMWRKRTTQTSTHYPICARTARERCAYTTSDDWAIFAMHSQYVRPLRDREWVPGEPCIIRRDSFELPPGACRYSESTSGLPATAFNSFVFPNPPRQFLMPSRGTSGCFELGQPYMGLRAERTRQGDRRRSPQLSEEQLVDLERMLWFDPEPRLERPFRLYADSKACLKGPIHDIGRIMRSGW